MIGEKFLSMFLMIGGFLKSCCMSDRLGMARMKENKKFVHALDCKQMTQQLHVMTMGWL